VTGIALTRTFYTQKLSASESLLRVGTEGRGAKCLTTADAPSKAALRVHRGGTISHRHSPDDCAGGRCCGVAL